MELAQKLLQATDMREGAFLEKERRGKGVIKFLSFLGTNKYEVCNYLYQDQKAENCCYIQEALLKMLIGEDKIPDKVVIFTTSRAFEANWIKNANEKCRMPG